MKNQVVIENLGFLMNEEGEYQLNGKHQKFVAVIREKGTSQEYVTLRKFSPDVDQREKSPRKGKHYISTIKDCCSQGSVERAIRKYDVEESSFRYAVGGCFLYSESLTELNKEVQP